MTRGVLAWLGLLAAGVCQATETCRDTEWNDPPCCGYCHLEPCGNVNRELTAGSADVASVQLLLTEGRSGEALAATDVDIQMNVRTHPGPCPFLVFNGSNIPADWPTPRTSSWWNIGGDIVTTGSVLTVPGVFRCPQIPVSTTFAHQAAAPMKVLALLLPAVVAAVGGGRRGGLMAGTAAFLALAAPVFAFELCACKPALAVDLWVPTSTGAVTADTDTLTFTCTEENCTLAADPSCNFTAKLVRSHVEHSTMKVDPSRQAECQTCSYHWQLPGEEHCNCIIDDSD